jgi:hypothetical protein
MEEEDRKHQAELAREVAKREEEALMAQIAEAERKEEKERKKRQWLPVQDEVPSDTKANDKGKGKGKAQRVLVTLSGDKRCEGCVGKKIPCVVDEAAIQRWEEDVGAGKTFQRTPAGGVCEECRSVKQKCHLPRTRHIRIGVQLEKRRRDEEGVEQLVDLESGPRQKKLRVDDQEAESTSSTTPCWAPELLGLLKGLEGWVVQQSRGRIAVNRFADMMNTLADRFNDDWTYTPSVGSSTDDADHGIEMEVTVELDKELEMLREEQ